MTGTRYGWGCAVEGCPRTGTATYVDRGGRKTLRQVIRSRVTRHLHSGHPGLTSRERWFLFDEVVRRIWVLGEEDN
jgi:hypothetical protein